MKAPVILQLPPLWKPAKPQPVMPLISTATAALSLVGFIAPFTVFLSMADGTPAAYRIGGAGLASALTLLMLTGRKPALSRWEWIFNLLASSGAGFLLPKPVLRMAGFDITSLDEETWAIASVLLGMVGPALIMAWWTLRNRSVNRVVELAADKLHLPPDKDDSAPEGEMKHCRTDEIRWCGRKQKP